MAKTIGDFLGGDPNQKKEPEHKTFYMDDVVERDPRQYCPSCDSREMGTYPAAHRETTISLAHQRSSFFAVCLLRNLISHFWE